MHFNFDGPTKTIIVDNELVIAGVAQFTVEHIYSEWKEWVSTGEGAKYPPAFRTVGGDPIGGGVSVGAYVFINNDAGWTLLPPDTDGVKVIVIGNLYPENINLPMFEYRPLKSAWFEMRNSSLTQLLVSGSGVTNQDKQDIANLVKNEGYLKEEDFLALK